MRASAFRHHAARLVAAGLTCACIAAQAPAQPLAPAPAPPDAGLQQNPGAALPLDLPFTDSEGHAVTLRDYFGDRPVLLVPGYYRCPQLCGVLMHGLLGALQRAGLPHERYRVLRVSLDPDETPADARARRAVDLAYAHFLDGARPATAPLPLVLLTGSETSVQALARALGIRHQRLVQAGGTGIAHPAVVVVATPAGRVSRDLPGVFFEPAELRLALSEAAGGGIGSLSDRLALLCAHLDPRLGRHSAAVLRGAQAMGVLLVLALAALWWRQARSGPR